MTISAAAGVVEESFVWRLRVAFVLRRYFGGDADVVVEQRQRRRDARVRADDARDRDSHALQAAHVVAGVVEVEQAARGVSIWHVPVLRSSTSA